MIKKVILIMVLFSVNLSFAQNIPATSQTVISAPDAQNKISLDVKGMDVTDVLKILATRAGYNIIIGKNVTGRTTLYLKDVDINDAFEIVILANDLAYDKKGDITNIMTTRDYELIYGGKFADKKQLLNITLKYAKSTALLTVLNQIKSNIGKVVADEPTNTVIVMDLPEKLLEIRGMIEKLDRPLETRIFSLNYAQAEKLNAKIQETVTKAIGTVKFDERTNKIIITDYPEKLEEIAKIINAFDEKTRQVLIDAQIVEITPDKDEFSMGVDWDYWIRKNVNLITPLAAPALTSAAVIGTKIAMGVASGDQTANPGKPGQYKAIVNALRVIGQTKIISSPRIMALNNQEAKLLVGTKEAYITSTTSQSGTGSTITSQSVNFIDVGIKLYVTPTINKDNFITIKVRPEISSSETRNIKSQDTETQIPIVTTSETETTIMIKNGTTIMIAGLKKNKSSKEVKKIPILGDIPLLKYFFRNTKDETNKTELVIFLTPYVVTGDEPLEYKSLTNDKDILKAQADSFFGDKSITSASAKLDYFGDYKATIFNKIKAIFSELNKGENAAKGTATVLFVIGPDGLLKEEPIVLASNSIKLDGLAIKSIKSSTPFPVVSGGQGQGNQSFKINLSCE